MRRTMQGFTTLMGEKNTNYSNNNNDLFIN